MKLDYAKPPRILPHFNGGYTRSHYNFTPSGVEFFPEKVRCRKWKEYNEKVYPPAAPDETPRPAYVCVVKEDLRYSYKKLWYVASFIRGMSICEALKQLEFLKTKGTGFVKEALLEAQKKAVEEHNVEFKTNLWVSESFVGRSKIIKSFKRAARGRMLYIRHRYTHYFLTLEEGSPPDYYYYHKRPKSGEEKLEEWLQEMRQRKSTHEEFRDSLHNARNILTRYSETWTNLMEKGEALPEMIREQARSAVGKATLLLGKKLKHFEELLDQAENKTAIKDISINDLLGYWELMECQVNEVKNLFENIEGFKTESKVEVGNRPG